MRSGSLCELTGSCRTPCAAPGSRLQVPLRELLLAQSTAMRSEHVAHSGLKSPADNQVRARRGGPARCAGRTLPSCTGFALTSTLGLPHFWHTWVLRVLPLPQNEQGQPLGMLTGSTTRRGCRQSARTRCDLAGREMRTACARTPSARSLTHGRTTHGHTRCAMHSMQCAQLRCVRACLSATCGVSSGRAESRSSRRDGSQWVRTLSTTPLRALAARSATAEACSHAAAVWASLQGTRVECSMVQLREVC